MNAPVARLVLAMRRGSRGRARRAASSRSSTTAAGGPGLIPLWVGEGDLPTPAFICEAAARSLAAGETFYTWQRGIPELRAGARALSSSGSTAGRSPPERFSSRSAACTRPRSPCAWRRAPATRSSSRRRPGRISPAPSPSRGARAGRGADDSSGPPAGRSISIASAPPSRRAPARSSSTRRPTRPAGPRAATTRAPSSRSRAGTASGSSPTRSTPASSTTRP